MKKYFRGYAWIVAGYLLILSFLTTAYIVVGGMFDWIALFMVVSTVAIAFLYNSLVKMNEEEMGKNEI